MGERYQIHLRFKEEKNLDNKPQYTSIHLQWCWGSHIIRNLNRLLKTLSNTECEYPSMYNLGNYARSILEVNKGLEGHNYPFGVFREDEPYKTFQGDSNHGWCVLFINISKKGKFKVKSLFYDTSGKLVTNEDLWEDALKELSYHKISKEEIAKYKKLIDKKLFNNAEEDLQEIFNKGIENLNVEKEKEIKKNGYKLKYTILAKGKNLYTTSNRIEKELKKAGFEVGRHF